MKKEPWDDFDTEMKVLVLRNRQDQISARLDRMAALLEDMREEMRRWLPLPEDNA